MSLDDNEDKSCEICTFRDSCFIREDYEKVTIAHHYYLSQIKAEQDNFLILIQKVVAGRCHKYARRNRFS